MFEEWLALHYPDRAGRVLSLIRQCREDRLNDTEFGRRIVGGEPYGFLLNLRMARAENRHGLRKPMPDFDCTKLRPVHLVLSVHGVASAGLRRADMAYNGLGLETGK